MENEDVYKEEKKKSNKGLIITIIILCIIVVVLGVLLFLNTGNKSNSSNSNNKSSSSGDNKQTEEIEEDEESTQTTSHEEVSDDIKFDLYNKINVLFNSRERDSYSESTAYLSYGFRSNVLKDSLSNYDKQQIVLEYLKFENINNSRWESVPKVKSAIEKDLEHLPNAKDEYGYLPFDFVNNYYQKLFGKTLSNPEEEIGKCPKFVYSKETDEFYRFRFGCGGASSGSVLTYISKFDQRENYIVVYLSAGLIVDNSILNDGSGFAVYKDIDYNSSSKQLVTTVENSDYIINSDNYEKFSQYKLTFKKDQDNYYFSGSKQVK